MIAALLLSALALAFSADTVVVGSVRDTTGLPLPGAQVYVRGADSLSESTETDQDGRFRLPVARSEPFVLVVFLSGFLPESVEVAANGSQVTHDFVLKIAPVTEALTVRSSHDSPTVIGARLTPLDIVRTPGTRADALRVLQSFPGVVAVDESASLFVRGGDSDETRVLLDEAPLFHPYRYETPTGGIAGAVEPFQLERLTFLTGGFPARYGDALSAVVDMRGLSRPTARGVSGTAGLSGVSSKVALPIGERSGVRLAANMVDTDVLFALNKPPQRFSEYPQGWDVNGVGYYANPSLGSLRVLGMTQYDRVGVEIAANAFSDIAELESRNSLTDVVWQRSFGRWGATALVSESRYSQDRQVGVLALDTADVRRTWRADFERSGAWTLRVGSDGAHSTAIISGQVPAEGTDYLGVNGTTPFNTRYGDVRGGVYGEVERQTGRIRPNLGARLDRFDRSDVVSASPRASVLMMLSRQHRLRLAWGVYRQAPAPEYWDAVRGASHLDPMRAQHMIVAYETSAASGTWTTRLEGYRKVYSALPLEDVERGYVSSGYGHANGFDAFLAIQRVRGDVRLSYSWVQARRRWTSSNQQFQYVVPEEGTWRPDFDVPHSFQAVGRLNITARLTLGASWRAASGVPFTPVVGALPIDTGFDPVYGTINSDRMPPYRRLDLSLSRISAWHGNLIVLFAGLDNALGRSNVFFYTYSPDYQQRFPFESVAKRALFFGVSITR